MKPSNEAKARFFALYYGQEIQRAGDDPAYFETNPEYTAEDWYLELKPLQAISDEDAYGVGILVNCWSKSERNMDSFKDDKMKDIHILAGQMFAEAIGKEWGPGMSHPFANNSTDILAAYDYLRSRGYALPFMGLSVEKMVELGWRKLQGEVKH